MASGRRVFFSFHYDRDVWRTNTVRNSQVVEDMKKRSWIFYDAADREAVRRKSPHAVKSWIEQNMKGTSVTVVLIGAETSTRYWVQYEIRKSVDLRKGLLGVINPLPLGYPTYDWFPDNGYQNLGVWIEQAARATGR